MRFYLTLAVLSGLMIGLAGCGSEPVTQTASNDDTSNDQVQGVGAGGAPPSSGPPSQSQQSSQSSGMINESPSAAGAGDVYGGAGQTGRPQNDPNRNPYENEQPGFAGAGGDQPYGGAGQTGRPQGEGENQPYGGDGQTGRPQGQGGGSSPSAPGGGVPLPGGGSGTGGGGSTPSAPGGGVPLPGGGSGSGAAGGGNTPSAPGGGAPLPGGGGYGGDISGQGDPYAGGNSSNQAAAQQEPKNFKEKSLAAFRDGNDDAAFRYMYAYYLTDRDGMKDHQLKLMPHSEEPRTAIRWGVGMTYAPPKDYTKDPPKIGTEPVINPNGGGRTGGRGGNPYGGGGGPPSGAGGNPYGGGGGRGGSGPKDELVKYTGDIGEVLVERLAQRRTYDGGFYGNILAELKEEDAGGNRGRTQGSSSGANLGGAGASMLDDGPIGGSSGNPYTGGNNNRNNDSTEKPEIPQLLPGVQYFGIVDGQDDFLTQAKENNLDAVVLLSVDVDVNRRTGTETTGVRMRLIDVATGDLVYASRRALTNISVWNDRQKSGERDDPVELELDRVFAEKADLEYKLAPLSYTASQAEERVSILTASQHSNPLSALAEIRYYHSNGLLDDRKLSQAYSEILGEADGKKLSTGTEKEKIAAIQKWLPGGVAADDSSDGGFR